MKIWIKTICYGKTMKSIAEDLNVDEQKAQEIYDCVLTNIPGLKRFMDESQEMARQLGYVEDKDLQSILRLKDESKKRFDLNLDFSSSADAKVELEQRLEFLKKENSVLKSKVRYLKEKKGHINGNK